MHTEVTYEILPLLQSVHEWWEFGMGGDLYRLKFWGHFGGDILDLKLNLKEFKFKWKNSIRKS